MTTLDKAVKLCKAKEATTSYLDDMRPLSMELAAVVTKPNTSRGILSNCKYCGASHEYGKCPAFGERCRKCKRMGHFSVRCYRQKEPTDATLTLEDSSETVDLVFAATESCRNEWFINLTLANDASLRIKVDTGSTRNVMSVATFNGLSCGARLKKKPVYSYAHTVVIICVL
ncbi:Uncharacterised protein at_DN0315 [Pycnogonum litorale]